MEQPLLHVLINGNTLDGFDVEVVKSNVAKAFKINDERVAKLFSGSDVFVKKNVELTIARKYQSILGDAGAYSKLVYAHDGTEYNPNARKITCPKCAHEQYEAVNCSRCKMSLVRYLKKLAFEDAKRKRRVEALAHAV